MIELRSLARRLLLAVLMLGGVSAALAAGDLDDLLAMPGDEHEAVQLGGFVEGAAARTYAGEDHWSKLRWRGELIGSGSLGEGMRWRLGVRADLDHAYVLEDDFYPTAVLRDQRDGLSIREAYVDVPYGDWEFRFGRQHVVWGEMVGLFFADVVSARDMREFFLPEFEQLRIPQWAARAEYFGADDFHGELLWVPVATVDEIGKPGSDFYGFRPELGVPFAIASQDRPPSRLGHGNWGLRAGKLVEGWDLAGFYYNSIDVSPTFYFDAARLLFTPRHDRVRQFGATFSKDFNSMVLKGEAVHASGRKFNTARPGAPDGLFDSETMDYALGLDVPIANVWRFNVQLFGRRNFSLDSFTGLKANETGGSLLVNRQFGDDLEVEVLVVTGFNRGDYMARPMLTWRPDPLWRMQAGLDVFGGNREGLFGRFDQSDRAYVELRRSF